MSDIFDEHLKESLNKIPENVCCVCGHPLGNHIDEGDIWRCHSLGQDFYQCECALRKGRTIDPLYIGPDPIDQYDLKIRLTRQIKELRE